MWFLAVLIWEVICKCSKRMGSGDWRKLLDASCYWSIGKNRSLGKKHSELPTCPHLLLSKEISAMQFPSRKLRNSQFLGQLSSIWASLKLLYKMRIRSLQPGGVLYIGIHLYTSNSGHHDLRAFTGFPLPFWAHLRASTSHLIQPSSYLNEWRPSRVAIAFWTRSQRVRGISRILRFRTRLD